jgi:excisionase family DNA binding protein
VIRSEVKDMSRQKRKPEISYPLPTAARLLGVPLPILRAAVDDGRIPSVGSGEKTAISREVIERLHQVGVDRSLSEPKP